MADANDPFSGGTTDPGGICWVSPADMAGQVNNLLTRVTQIESVLNQLLGVDITAIDAADLAPGMGLLVGGTLVSPADVLQDSMTNWAGTVLPGDFSGSVLSGNVLTTWTNGVVSFQVTDQGVTVGGGGGSKYMVAADLDVTGLVVNSGWNALPFSNPSNFQDTIGCTFYSNYFTVPRSGWYYISCNVYCNPAFNSANGNIALRFSPSSSAGMLYDNRNWSMTGGSTFVPPYFISISGIIDLVADEAQSVDFSPALSGGANANTQIWNFSLIEL